VATHSEMRKEQHVLVFLPRSAAQVIVSKLIEHGYAASAVHSVPELFDALRSSDYSLAVTTRPDIDMVRNIKSIPVVNLEVFFHSSGSADEGLMTSKQFDGRAFLERITVLTEPRQSRGEASARSLRSDVVPSNRMIIPVRWWRALRSLLGRTPELAKK